MIGPHTPQPFNPRPFKLTLVKGGGQTTPPRLNHLRAVKPAA